MKVPPVNIFAFTAPGASYPDYISVNEGSEGAVSIAVRGNNAAAEVEISASEARRLGNALIAATETD